jgi:hypothetical protein
METADMKKDVPEMEAAAPAASPETAEQTEAVADVDQATHQFEDKVTTILAKAEEEAATAEKQLQLAA